MEFYGALFGWTFEVGPEEYGRYTHMPAGRPARRRAGAEPRPGATEFWWNVYLAADDVDATVARSLEAGGAVVGGPFDIPEQGRARCSATPVGAQFGLWQGSAHVGCEVVNEPGALIRNDLVTPTPSRRASSTPAVFDFTLEDNTDMPGRRLHVPAPAGRPRGRRHLRQPGRARFHVEHRVRGGRHRRRRCAARADAGGKSEEPSDMLYGRIASMSDPFGTEFSVITRATG